MQLNTYEWYFPPDTNIRGAGTKFLNNYFKNDTYPVKLLVNSQNPECGFVLEDTLNITKALNVFTKDTIFKCPGDSLIIVPSPAKNKQNYIFEWYMVGKGWSAKDTAPEFREKVDQEFRLNLKSIDTLNNCWVYENAEIKFHPNNANVGQNLFVCKSEDSVLLDGTPFNLNSYWNGRNVVKTGNQYYFLTKSINNEETVKLYYYPKDNACNYFDELEITVLDDGIDPLKDSIHLCQTQKVYTLTSPFTNTIWSGDKVGLGNTFQNNSKETGIFKIYLRVGDNKCIIRDTLLIHVFPEQKITIEPISKTICGGDTIYLKASLANASLTNYKWIETNGLGKFLGNTIYFNNAYIPDTTDLDRGNVRFSFKTKDKVCPGQEEIINVPIYYSPEAIFIASLTTEYVSFSVHFIDISEAKNSYINKRHSWDFGNGDTSSFEDNWVTYDSVGSYDVSLYVENHVGCSDITIKKDYINALPSSLPDLEKSGLTIYPNPFTSKILIKSEKPIQNIRLVNFEGKEVLNSEAKETQTELSTENFPKGIYLLEIEMEAGEVFRQTLIKN